LHIISLILEQNTANRNWKHRK